MGVGTSSPGGLLHVGASGAGVIIDNTYSELAPPSSGNDSYIFRSNSDGSLNFSSRPGAGGRSYRFWRGSNVSMIIDDSGRVGIGTTSADANSQLHIVGSSYQPLYVNTTGVGGGGAVFSRSGTQALVVGTAGSSWLTGSSTADGLIRSEANLIFATGGNSQRAQIDSSGRLLVGTSTTAGVNAILQTRSDGFEAINQENFYSAANAGGPNIIFAKSRGSAASPSVVSADDFLGIIRFRGHDGTDYDTSAAEITVQVDGTPGANDMPGRLVFSTTKDGQSSPSEAMRIGENGNVYIARTSTNATTRGTYFEGNGVGTWNCTQPNGGSSAIFRATSTGNQIGGIGNTTTSTSYNTSSDYRLKENVVPLTGAVDRINQLQVHRFNFIADPDKTVDGFIAHEAQEVVPECVTGDKDAVDDEGNPVFQGIDQGKLVPLLTAALQEAIAEIASLKDRVAALEAS